ncbi:EamA family transporter [Streptomyces sp. H10-C2]|uniref:EamA family transporter n=1 Tax=unclassified Streptomyces TaxID=2593676 RepID=UPI0024BB21BA|nr:MULTISPECIES: EamA family transporter [unclassified Streptomyces]MDJ0341386.1 EamA family transporter [Streptomyces sp. PH10-H1]MDJ0370981.1 EamA family transporter [Streptomyces sp. H10-C2]
MTPLITAAVLTAAVLTAAVAHASWNAIAHGIKDQWLAFTLMGIGGAVIGAGLACFAPVPASGAWPYLIASALLHIVYQWLLMQSFRLGDFGQVYPIARGIAPLLVTVLAAVFVGEQPDAWQSAGIVVASAGLAGVALWGMRGKRGQGKHWLAVAAAVATGASIAVYTVVDGVGVRASGSSVGYVGWLLLLMGFAIPSYVLATRRGELLEQLRPLAVRGLFGAVLSVFAYGLVLWAQTRGDLAPIAALRETSLMRCSYRVCHEPI